MLMSPAKIVAKTVALVRRFVETVGALQRRKHVNHAQWIAVHAAAPVETESVMHLRTANRAVTIAELALFPAEIAYAKKERIVTLAQLTAALAHVPSCHQRPHCWGM